MATLENAISLAVKAHQGQTELNGQPYILHPLRVMFAMQTEEEMIVAVLHDIIEDTRYTLDDLRQMGFAAPIIKAVDALTRRADEPYEAFIERIMLDPLARRVKLSDLRDNMDIRRLNELRDGDLERLRRYHVAWNRLIALADK